MNKKEHLKWSNAIATRMSDEWNLASDFPEDALKLRSFLMKALSLDKEAVKSFIGTGIIESDYFEEI